MSNVQFITKEDAFDAVHADKRPIIHCFIGSIGADWDKKDIIKEIEACNQVGWVEDIFKHNLAVFDGVNSPRRFDIQRT